jgi:hypothetical protein
MQVYKITNVVNGKIYIGKDIVSDKNYYGSGVLIKRAIEKYGKENFKKEILEECNSNNELCEKEKYWINYYNSTNLNIGYNISKGGDGGDTLSNNPNIDIIKSKISRVRKGKKYEDILPLEKVISYKEKLANAMSKRLKGKKIEEIYGIKKAKEIKRKQSISRKKIFENKPKKVKIKLTKEEIEQKRIEKLKIKYQFINDIEILKKRFFGYRKRNNIKLFIELIGEEKYQKIIDELKKPFKHKKESIDKIIDIKLKNYIKRKNELIEFLKNNPTSTRNDFYHNLSSKQISNRVRNLLHNEFSYFLTEEEKNLIKKRPKQKNNISQEKLSELKIKLSRPIIIDDIEYISASEASKILNIDRGTIRFRLKNDNYPNYKYL